MAQTKKEIRQAWDREHLKYYGVVAHVENEKEIIEYVEEQRERGEPVSAVFKRGIRELIERGR